MQVVGTIKHYSSSVDIFLYEGMLVAFNKEEHKFEVLLEKVVGLPLVQEALNYKEVERMINDTEIFMLSSRYPFVLIYTNTTDSAGRRSCLFTNDDDNTYVRYIHPSINIDSYNDNYISHTERVAMHKLLFAAKRGTGIFIDAPGLVVEYETRFPF